MKELQTSTFAERTQNSPLAAATRGASTAAKIASQAAGVAVGMALGVPMVRAAGRVSVVVFEEMLS